MLLIGILSGLLTALLQSFSYVGSAHFLHRYHSPIRLLLFSQLLMGAFCVLMLPLVLPGYEWVKTWDFWFFIGLWLVLFTTGQAGFFLTQRSIEASRLSSLLGLKIIVLWTIATVFLGAPVKPLELIAVLLATAAAVGMNWSGNGKFTLNGLLFLLMTLIGFALTDMAETRLVTLGGTDQFLHDALASCVVCYVLLGVASLPALFFFRPSRKQFATAIPFAATWLLSQAALFVCFALIGTVFGNVVQSSRGMISVLLGALLLRFGYGHLDARVSRAMWIRRILAALLMAVGIVLYALAH